MKRFLANLIFLVSLSFSQVVEAATIENIVVTPEDERDFVLANLPFEEGGIWKDSYLELSRRFLKASLRYQAFSVDWNSDSQTFQVRTEPALFFEDVIWRGDDFGSQSSIENACLNEREDISLSQQRLNEITSCINSRTRGAGYLDAKSIVYSEEGDLVIELFLGQRYRVDSIQFEGAKQFSESYLRYQIQNREGRWYQPFRLSEDTTEIFQSYLSRHYYLATVQEPTVKIDPIQKSVEIKWDIKEGDRIDIQFIGDYTSRKHLEERLNARDPLPDWFIDDIIDDIRDELRNEGYLDVSIEREVIQYSERHQRLKIHTKKGRQYWLVEPVWVGVDNVDLIQQIYGRVYNLQPGRRYGEERYRQIFEDEFFRELVREGFLDVKVQSLDFNIDRRRAQVEPVIYMNEGTQVRISELVFEGVQDPYDDIVEMNRLRDHLEEGEPLDPIRADELIEELLTGMRGRGYLDAEINLRWVATIEGHRVNVEIKSGPRYRVAEILLRGIDRTQVKVITREILIEKGDYYSIRDITDTTARLLRLGLARSVDIQVFEKLPEEGILYLVLEVREAPRFRFEFGPGFGTTDGLRGTFRGTYANIAGTGRRFSLFAKGSRELEAAKRPQNVLDDDAFKEPFIERRVSLEYFEPFVIGLPIDGRIVLTHERVARRQFSEENNSVLIGFDWRLSRNWTYSPSYKVEFTDPFNIEVTETARLDSSDSQRLHSFNQEILASYLDDVFSPQKGVELRAELELFDRRLGGDLNFWKLTLNQTFYYPLYRYDINRSVGFALSINQGFSKAYSTTEEVPVQERFRVGGEGSVRGYPEDGIIPTGEDGEPLRNGGLSTFYFRTEINFPIYKNFDLLGFFDGGNIYRLNTKFYPLDIRYGAGAGVRFNTPLGPVKFGYAFAIDRKENEDMGQLYFGVGPL